jgi:triphosphatase
LYQLLVNRAVMLDGDPEGLHQMRVALRRLRAGISLFSDMLTDSQTNSLKVDLKWIAGELGPAREIEVFLKRVVDPVADANPSESGVSVLSRDCANAGHASRERPCKGDYECPLSPCLSSMFERAF